MTHILCGRTGGGIHDVSNVFDLLAFILLFLRVVLFYNFVGEMHALSLDWRFAFALRSSPEAAFGLRLSACFAPASAPAALEHPPATRTI